jgi:uncharacterized protein (TIGR02147 family)
MIFVYDFLNFRDFLKAAFQEHKKQHRYFSHRYFLKEAGVRNSGYLKLVIDNKRSLTPSMVPGFAKALRLSEHERAYFTHLVGFNQAESAEDKEYHYRALKLLGSQVKRKIIGSDYFDLFEHWYIPVIRELVCLHDFKDDCKRIGKTIRPAVTPARVKKALAFLVEKKMIVRREGGGYAQTDPAIDTSDQITSLAVRNFNRQMISLAREALDRFNREERYVRGVTIGISKKTYSAIVQEIQVLNAKVVQMVGADQESDRVYQLNFQLFPLSSNPSGGKNAAR